MRDSTQTNRPRTRAEKRSANRDRILRAARKVFGARGYNGATIEDIAVEAGLSNGAIYYNFENKEELFLALLDERSDERLEHLRGSIGAGGGDRALVEEARDVTRGFKESREWRLLLLEFVIYAARNPRFARRFAAHKRRLRAALAEVLDSQLRERAFPPPLPLDQLALAVIGLANGLAVEELSDPGSVSEELFGDTLTLLVAPRSAGGR